MERFKKYFSVEKLLEKVQKHTLDSKKEMRPSTWSLYGKLYDTSNEEGERAFFADFVPIYGSHTVVIFML